MEVKKIVEGMTAVEVAEVIDSNFKAQNKILEEDIATQNSVIGVSEYKDFSESESVAVGDVRKYNGFLYECVEATTGAFDENKWKKSSFKAETEKKISDIEEKTDAKLSELGSEMRDSISFIYFSDKSRPNIKTNSYGNRYAAFTITMPNAILRAFVEGDNRFVNMNVSENNVFTIADTNGLYFNWESMEFSVKAISTVHIEANELFLFGNSAGVAFGALARYYYDDYAYTALLTNENQDKILKGVHSYWYFSEKSRPYIVANSYGNKYASFTITMPDAYLRGFYNDNQRVANLKVSPNEVYKINDTQALYFNLGTQSLIVKTIGTDAIGYDDYCLFGNSAGVAFGILSQYYYDDYAYSLLTTNDNHEKVLKGIHSYWYFSDKGRPNIVTNSYGNRYASFTITMPDTYLRGYYNNNQRIVNIKVSSTDVYKINDTQALYYNFETQSLVVKTVGTDSVGYDDFCLFGNTAGIAFGELARYYYDDYAFDLLSKQDEMMAYSKKIPTYFNEQLESTKTTIINRSNVGTDGEQFIFISDLHWVAVNSQNSPSLINYLLRKTPMSKVFLGGDYISSYSTKEAARDRLIMCTNQFKNLPADVFFLYGNHDNNSNQSNTAMILSPKEVFCLLQSQMKGIVYGDYYYFYTDNPTTKTRFLCLSSGPMPNADSETGISTAEYNWVREILQDTPKDYHCIVFIHAVKADADGDYTASAKELFSILDGNNASGGCRVEAVFSGHTHKDFNGYTDGGIPVIIIDTDGTGTVGDIAAEVGTITEQCFDAVTIDYDNKVIYCDRIGRGQSRVINY